ncbi:MAG TPA: metalloregulator ArsR/SmtB family transcription factor [Spirochaetota bacterium]
MYETNKPVEVCDVSHIRNDVVSAIHQKLPGEESIESVSGFFKALADPTRMRILLALSVSEICVCDLSGILSMHQSAISHQLKTLKLHNLVKSRRDGKVIYYSLSDSHVEEILSLVMKHMQE